VTIDVLGHPDLAVPHLVRYLHVGCAGGDEQRRTHVPQLVRCVADDAIGVRGGVALSELEVLTPGGVAKEAVSVTVDQAAVPPALALLAAGRAPVD
jgi:hypothetical protein